MSNVGYTDPTPNNFPDDYDPSQVDSRIKLRSESLKHKRYGKYTREALYQGLEIGGAIAGEAKKIAANTAVKQIENENKVIDGLEKINNAISTGTTDQDISEVKDARKPAGKSAFPTVGARLDRTINYSPQFEISKKTDTSSTAEASVLAYAKTLDITKFNMSVITDTHFENHPDETLSGSYKYGYKSLSHLELFSLLGNYANALVTNGDNVHGMEPTSQRDYAIYSQIMSSFFDRDTTADKFAILGNHDDNSPMHARLNSWDAGWMSDEQIKVAHRTQDCAFGELRNGDSLYFYKDYPDFKIRLIGLETEDIDYSIKDASGNPKYSRFQWHNIRQEQMNWIAQTALMNVPNNYHVMIICHCPIYVGWTDSNSHYLNYDILQGLINAFISGAKYNGVSSDNDIGTGMGVNVTADFSEQGARTFIGMFAGHTHKEDIVNLGNFKCVQLMNDICTTDANANTDNEPAFTTIEVDTANRQVKLLGFGRATNRSFNY